VCVGTDLPNTARRSWPAAHSASILVSVLFLYVSSFLSKLPLTVACPIPQRANFSFRTKSPFPLSPLLHLSPLDFTCILHVRPRTRTLSSFFSTLRTIPTFSVEKLQKASLPAHHSHASRLVDVAMRTRNGAMRYASPSQSHNLHLWA
jgi:hypothetical protein